MKKHLKIGVVANTSFNILNFRMGLIKALLQNGYDVVIIAPEDEHTAQLKASGIPFFPIKGLSRKGSNPIKDLMLAIEFFFIYRKLNLNVALQYTIKPNIYGSLGGFLAGVKTVSTVTGLGYVFLNKGLTSTIAKWLYKIAFTFTGKVLFQNQDDYQLFVNEGLVKVDKADVVPGSGIDTQFFHPDFCKKQTKDGHSTSFVMIARLLIDKGLREYIEAARLVKKVQADAHFVLAGDLDQGNPAGIKKEELDAWIKEGVIDYRGFQKDTRAVICAADAVVLPSYREGMPRVILEGMSMGKPCITTDTPGCRDTIVNGESGFLCKVADAPSLADSLLKFVNLTTDERSQMGRKSRMRAENEYSIERVTSEYLSLLKKWG